MQWGRFSVLLTITLIGAGCNGARPRLREDPFLPTTASRQQDKPDDDRAEPKAARKNRDVARGISTSPATDEDAAVRPSTRDRDGDSASAKDSATAKKSVGRPDEERAPPAKSNGPFPDDKPAAKRPAIDTRPRDDEALPPSRRDPAGDDGPRSSRLTANGAAPPPDPQDQALRYKEIRGRLDKAGARNFSTGPYPDPAAPGQTLIHCEVPHPSDPDKIRVFEAHDTDELKAALAVAEAVEKWIELERSQR